MQHIILASIASWVWAASYMDAIMYYYRGTSPCLLQLLGLHEVYN